MLVDDSRSIINLLMFKFIKFISSQAWAITWPYVAVWMLSLRTRVGEGLCCWNALRANNGHTLEPLARLDHSPIHAEDCVAIVHKVHIHFLNVLMFHHAEGEEIHSWKKAGIYPVLDEHII